MDDSSGGCQVLTLQQFWLKPFPEARRDLQHQVQPLNQRPDLTLDDWRWLMDHRRMLRTTTLVLTANLHPGPSFGKDENWCVMK